MEYECRTSERRIQVQQANSTQIHDTTESGGSFICVALKYSYPQRARVREEERGGAELEKRDTRNPSCHNFMEYSNNVFLGFRMSKKGFAPFFISVLMLPAHVMICVPVCGAFSVLATSPFPRQLAKYYDVRKLHVCNCSLRIVLGCVNVVESSRLKDARGHY